MSSVPRRNTKPEVTLRRALHRLGMRYRLHVEGLPGCPDMVFPRHGAVVFVHGCFWHDHGCSRSTKPSTRAEFWAAKFQRNRERDARDAGALEAAGWRVATVWECSLRTSHAGVEQLAGRLKEWIIDGRGLNKYPPT